MNYYLLFLLITTDSIPVKAEDRPLGPTLITIISQYLLYTPFPFLLVIGRKYRHKLSGRTRFGYTDSRRQSHPTLPIFKTLANSLPTI